MMINLNTEEEEIRLRLEQIQYTFKYTSLQI